MKITFEIVNVPTGDYYNSENYPHYGWFLFVEQGESGWMGAALVKGEEGEDLVYGLIARKREPIVAEILSHATEGDDSETKTFSFEDILRALAAAAGTLPPDLK